MKTKRGQSAQHYSFSDPHGQPVVQPVFRNARTLLIDRRGAPIPTDRCFKCNCSTEHEVRKTFTCNGGLLRFLVLIQPLLLPFVLPLYLMRQNRVSVAFGLCGECRERRHLGMALGAALLVASTPFFVYGALTITTFGPISGICGAILFCAGLLMFGRSRHLADSKRVDDRWIILSGGGDPFLAAIPERSDIAA